MNRRIFCWLGVLLLAPVLVRGGTTLSVRLVEASNNGAGVDPGLADVAGLLQGSLRFTRYRLVAQKRMRLPASQTVTLAGYAVQCEGPQRGLRIRVRSKGTGLLDTTANLRDGKPLVLGGFPAKSGKLILVFLAQ